MAEESAAELAVDLEVLLVALELDSLIGLEEDSVEALVVYSADKANSADAVVLADSAGLVE